MDHIDIDGPYRYSPSTSNLPSSKHLNWSSRKRIHRTFCWLFVQQWFWSKMTINTYLFQKKCNLYPSCAFQVCSSSTLTYLLHSCTYPMEILTCRDILQMWTLLELDWNLKGRKWRKITFSHVMRTLSLQQSCFLKTNKPTCFSFTDLSNQNIKDRSIFFLAKCSSTVNANVIMMTVIVQCMLITYSETSENTGEKSNFSFLLSLLFPLSFLSFLSSYIYILIIF